MKLNLLPTTASTGGGSRFAWVLAVIIIAASVYFSLSMKGAGEKVLSGAKDDVAANQDASDKVIALAASADDTIKKSTGPLLNVTLAKAMNAHNSVYPAFYDEVKTYIPNYFRLTSLQATPNDETTCTLTMQGTVGSFQQYANLMLALLRIKGATGVSRSGYQLNDVYVPPLAEDDQVGRPVKQGEARLTDDPIQRLDTKIAEATETDYSGTGGFGTPGLPMVRGAMPDESLITVVVIINRNLETPNPRSTLSGAGAAFAASSATDTTTPTAAPAPGAGPGG